MTKKPIYRLQSQGYQTDDEEGRGKVFKQYLLASIEIPDVLPIGSAIHLRFDFANPDQSLPPPNLQGGCFFKVAEGGKLEFDGT